MKDFFAYFFGVGEEPEFAIFTFAHFAPIVLMIAVILLLFGIMFVIRMTRGAMMRNRSKRRRQDRRRSR